MSSSDTTQPDSIPDLEIEMEEEQPQEQHNLTLRQNAENSNLVTGTATIHYNQVFSDAVAEERPDSERTVIEKKMLSESRDVAFENIVGNMAIAVAQLLKLRTMAEAFVNKGKKVSTHQYEHDGQWFRVTQTLEKIPSPEKKDDDLK